MRSILLLFLVCSCSFFLTGKDAPKSAKGTMYKAKFDQAGWLSKKDQRSDYVFENKKNGHIMLSNSFCDEFQDQPLENLATKTFNTISLFKPTISEYTTFHNREAYKLEGTGTVDGVKVGLRLLNTRRNNCYFDFVSIAPMESTTEADPAFNQFLKSVVFK